MMQKRGRFGAVSTELVVGVSLAAIAGIIAIGLFSDNLSDLVANSKLGNTYTGNSTKTQYNSFDRDYSASQIEVQIMGEQGLSLLRKQANNKAIELIEESFSKSNQNADSIAYLGTAIKSMTGEPHICLYLKTESYRHCDKIGGYDYTLDIGDSALTINKVNAEGTVVSKTVELPLDNQVASVIGSKPVTVDSNRESTFTRDEKYTYITDLTDKVVSHIRSDARLTKSKAKTFKTKKAATTSRVLADITSIVSSIKNAIDKDYNDCDDWDECWFDSGSEIVSKSERNNVQAWADSLKDAVTNAGENVESMKNAMISALNSGNMSSVLDDMNDGDRTCSTFINGLVNFSNSYGFSIKDFGITDNGNIYAFSRGGQTCRAWHATSNRYNNHDHGGGDHDDDD